MWLTCNQDTCNQVRATKIAEIESLMSDSAPVVLRSPSNPVVKHLVRMRNNRARRKAGAVIVDGWRETSQSLAARMTLRGLYYCQPEPSEEANPDTDWRQRVLCNSDAITKSTWVTPSILDKIGYGDSSRGVVAEFERPDTSLTRFGRAIFKDESLPPVSQSASSKPLILVLDRIEKPGNIGAIFRTADAAGVDGVLICDGGDSYHPNAIRSSSGGVFHVPWAEASLEEAVMFLQSSNARVLAARVEASKSCWVTDYSGCVAIVMGNEADGLQSRWSTFGGKQTEGIHIPMAGQVDSLNVSVAAAVLVFAARQARTVDA